MSREFQVITTNYNFTTLGVGIIENSDMDKITFTPMDFYMVFDELSKFLQKDIVYKRPKLYKTRYDRRCCKLKKTWGDKYELLTYPNDHGFTYNYGVYTKDELLCIWVAMREYVLSATKDPIFNKQSSDISNIGFNPYTIYKDVYPNSPITLKIMFYFIRKGEWVYCSKTLQENLDYIRNKYNEDFSNVLNDMYYQLVIEDMTEEKILFELNFINCYKQI